MSFLGDEDVARHARWLAEIDPWSMDYRPDAIKEPIPWLVKKAPEVSGPSSTG